MNSAIDPGKTGMTAHGSLRLAVCSMLVFGVVASTLPVLTNSLLCTRLGMVAAIWAAAFATLTMLKHRRDHLTDAALTDEVKAVYERALDRETTTRREYELGVEARLRRGVDCNEFGALRAEVASLRSNVEWLVEVTDANNPAPEGRRGHTPTTGASTLPWGTPHTGRPQAAPATAEQILTGSAAGSGPPAGPERQPGADSSPSGNPPPWQLHSWYTGCRPFDNVPASEFENERRSGSRPLPLLEVTLPALPPFDAYFEEPLHTAPTAPNAPDSPVSGRTSADQPASDSRSAAILDDGSHSTGLTVAQIMANLRSETRPPRRS